MNRLAVLAAVAVAVAAIGVGALALRGLSPQASVVQVVIIGYAFSPSAVTARAGTTRWEAAWTPASWATWERSGTRSRSRGRLSTTAIPIRT